MVTRIGISVFSALILGLLLAVPALAGGWAVITLDQLPGEAVVNQALDIGFMVRQHGRTPMAGLSPTVTARLSGSNQVLIFEADAEGAVGHYVAQITLPEAGTWDWSIQAFTMNQSMPALTVVAATQQLAAPTPAPASIPAWQVLGTLGVAAFLVGLFLIFRQRPRWAVPLLVGGLVLGIFGYVSVSSAQAEAPQVQEIASTELSAAEFGQQLFVAKGCTTCHAHPKISRSKDNLYIDAGPNLSKYIGASPDYLTTWLKNPTSLKPRTEMPTLELNQVEIEALVAFLTTK